MTKKVILEKKDTCYKPENHHQLKSGNVWAEKHTLACCIYGMLGEDELV